MEIYPKKACQPSCQNSHHYQKLDGLKAMVVADHIILLSFEVEVPLCCPAAVQVQSESGCLWSNQKS